MFNRLDEVNLSLSRALASHMELLSQKTMYERENQIIGGLPQIALIVAQGQLITEFDFANARRMLLQSVERFPDLHYIFLTNNPRMADDLTYGSRSYGEPRNTQYHVINQKSTNIDSFKEQLINNLRNLPRRIISTVCPVEFDGHRVQYNIKK